jgi:hypothetical protein
MKVYRKVLNWYQLTSCNQCGDDFWCKTSPDQDLKLQGFCETCSLQNLDEIISSMEKVGLADKIESLKLLVKIT